LPELSRIGGIGERRLSRRGELSEPEHTANSPHQSDGGAGQAVRLGEAATVSLETAPPRSKAAVRPSSTPPAPQPKAKPTAKTEAGSTPTSATGIAQMVFNELNGGRRRSGLPALNWNPGLQRSAYAHNLAMASEGRADDRQGV
jgi:uncharacterized protein YkwD